MLLKGSGAVDPRVIFDNKKNGRLEGGGGRAPRGLNNSSKSKPFYSHQMNNPKAHCRINPNLSFQPARSNTIYYN